MTCNRTMQTRLLFSLSAAVALCCPRLASAWEYSETRNAFGEVVGTGVQSAWVYPLQNQRDAPAQVVDHDLSNLPPDFFSLQSQIYPAAQVIVPCSNGKPQVKFDRPHELTNWIDKYREPTSGDRMLEHWEQQNACGFFGNDAACIGHGIGKIVDSAISAKPGETRYRLDIRVGNKKGKVNVSTFDKAPNHAFVTSRRFPRYLATGELVAIAFDWQEAAGGFDPIAYRWESIGFAETFSQVCRKTIRPTDPSKRKRKRIRDEF